MPGETVTGYKLTQLGLFVPTDYKPAPQKWAPCPPDIRQRLRELRAEFAAKAAAPKRAGMRY